MYNSFDMSWYNVTTWQSWNINSKNIYKEYYLLSYHHHIRVCASCHSLIDVTKYNKLEDYLLLIKHAKPRVIFIHEIRLSYHIKLFPLDKLKKEKFQTDRQMKIKAIQRKFCWKVELVTLGLSGIEFFFSYFLFYSVLFHTIELYFLAILRCSLLCHDIYDLPFYPIHSIWLFVSFLPHQILHNSHKIYSLSLQHFLWHTTFLLLVTTIIKWS